MCIYIYIYIYIYIHIYVCVCYRRKSFVSKLKRCAILKFVILYINYLLPVSSNMNICNCKTNRNDNMEKLA